ncbi:MAG: hypothetical protein QXU69_10445 [Thermofilaceae archaeon]
MEVVNENYENLDVAAPAGRDFSSFNTPPAGGAGGATTAPGEKKRIASTPEDIVFLTDTDQQNYPIYITEDREVWLKARPHRLVGEDEWNRKRVYDVPIVATFFVKNVEETNAELSHELLEIAKNIMQEVTKKEVTIRKVETTYEVYQGDVARLLGEAKAYTIKIISDKTPYSGVKHSYRQAWAIGYDWKKRIVAKEPRLEKYAYLKGEEGKHGRAYVRLYVKLPVVTEEFAKLFDLALASAVAQTSIVSELEEQAKQLEEIIAQKERELQVLREQLAQLHLKLQLERMKRAVVE